MSRKNIQRLISDKLIRNIGWLSASQIFVRLFRLLAVVVLARKLTTEDYGIIAIIFTVTDFAYIFIQKGGVAPKLIQADPADLDTLSDTAYWINWILCISVFIAQCLAAFPIAAFYDNNQLILPIMVIGVAYLFNPIYAIQDALIRRENRLKISAIATAIYALVSNSLIFILALTNMGLWSVVIAKSVSHVVWIVMFRYHHSWRPSRSFTLHRWKDIFNFSKFPLGIELLNYLRSNIDYLLIGRFFSLEALGLYFFAFNAGLGISLSAINMVTNSVFPYLCEARTNRASLKKSYGKSLKVVATIMIPLVLLQSSLAPFYVPIVFGEKWISAIPILIMVCLSGIPRAFAIVSEQLLLTVDRGLTGLKWNVGFTALFVVVILCSAQFSIYAVAASVLAVHLVCLPLFSIWVSRSTFPRSEVFSN
ncbi:MAG: lipopolysaccharide biosynthesis protein [Leptolyngbya foveolarum]|uniref:Lipopolysaccharide biosynthesis protein n=1 Tax=Leptolyngbya foveolarum TaxID=47253 RepID=A0A2W4UNM5_9CYAN|nr:MAG: lipopolysaccharide biosynthesis protein [Leptolyngbya foveolarum]